MDCSFFASEIERECFYFLTEFEVLLVFGWCFEVFVETVDLHVTIFVACDEGVLGVVQTCCSDFLAL